MAHKSLYIIVRVSLLCSLLLSYNHIFCQQNNDTTKKESTFLKQENIVLDLGLRPNKNLFISNMAPISLYNFQKSSTHEAIKYNISPMNRQNGFSLLGYHNVNEVYGVNMIGLSHEEQLGNNVVLTISPFISSSFVGFAQSQRKLNGGVNATLLYRFPNRVILGVTGQYAFKSELDPILMNMGAVGSYYGGYIIIPVSEKVGIQAGVQRGLFKGKWVTSYYILPYFYNL